MLSVHLNLEYRASNAVHCTFSTFVLKTERKHRLCCLIRSVLVDHALQMQWFYRIFCRDFPHEKFVGMYQLQTPTLLLRDPEIIRLFLVKSFTHFTDRGFLYDGHREPLTKHLVNLEGDMWKTLRQKLTPTFSSGKIKSMVGLLQGCGVQLLEYMEVIPTNLLSQQR